MEQGTPPTFSTKPAPRENTRQITVVHYDTTSDATAHVAALLTYAEEHYQGDYHLRTHAYAFLSDSGISQQPSHRLIMATNARDIRAGLPLSLVADLKAA